VADEPFSWRLVVGGLLIVGGVIAVQGNIPFVRKKLPAVVAALVALLGVGLGACAAGEPSAQDTTTSSTKVDAEPQGCGEIVEERLDPNSGRHLLPGAEEPAFLSDPPTSGAHASGGRPPDGMGTEPVTRPVQVQLLEAGRVIIQFRTGELTDGETGVLESLAGEPNVVIAPNESLPAPVVATAWQHKMLCEDADETPLRTFVSNYAGKGPGGH
jgi:hypothetical protein